MLWPWTQDQHGAKVAAQEGAASESSGGREESALQGQDSKCEVKPDTCAAKKEEIKAEAKGEVKDEVKAEVKTEVKKEVFWTPEIETICIVAMIDIASNSCCLVFVVGLTADLL